MAQMQRRLAIALAAASAFAGIAWAAVDTALPDVKTQGSVSFLTGGIGHDEALAMKHAESQYPLSMEFVEKAKPHDEYLAAVAVTVKDHKGKTALDTISDGPYLLADLPAGKYTVHAIYDGKTLTKDATVVKGKPQQLVFDW